jgi:hypothetical protein
VRHGSSFVVQNLKPVLLAAYEPSTAQQIMIPFNVWSESCKSNVVRRLLLQPHPLLQKLRRFFMPSCAVRCLDCLCEALLLPWVSALLSWEEL